MDTPLQEVSPYRALADKLRGALLLARELEEPTVAYAIECAINELRQAAHPGSDLACDGNDLMRSDLESEHSEHRQGHSVVSRKH